jgi:hypothetical protein
MATTYTDGEELVSASTFDLDASSVTTIKTSATQLKSFFAGGVAGMIANSVLHPFDTVSMRMKVQKSSNLKYAGFSHAVRTILREGKQ